MLTRYTLEIDGTAHEIPVECIKNWADIKCAYKRSDLSGITRTFTSQFEFVGEAYELILRLYLRDGLNAVANLTFYTLTEHWEWQKQFTVPLDFPSISWDGRTLRISCIDNSLATLIKANRSTKYELVVGEDVPKADSLFYDRISIIDTVDYQIIGESNDNDDSMSFTLAPWNETKVRVGYITESTPVNTSVFWSEDQEENEDGFIIEALEDVTLDLTYGFAVDVKNLVKNLNLHFDLVTKHPDGTINKLRLFTNQPYAGYFRTEDGLPQYGILASGTIAEVDGIVYELGSLDESTPEALAETFGWHSTDKNYENYIKEFPIAKTQISLVKGDKVSITATVTPSYQGWTKDIDFKLIDQKIQFTWADYGQPISADVVAPTVLLQSVVDRICKNKVNAIVDIMDDDVRFKKTYLIAGESLRRIDGAKIYTSFNEFKDWMQTVFGYTYYLTKRIPSRFIHIEKMSGFVNGLLLAEGEFIDGKLSGTPTSYPYYIDSKKVFAVKSATDSKYYTQWDAHGEIPDSYAYNADGVAMSANIYDNNGQPYYAVDGGLIRYKRPLDKALLDEQHIVFTHMSKIFDKGDSIRRMDGVRDVSYSVDNSGIYSSVTIGYETQEYKCENGRDEFNFANTYSTGCTSVEKELALISKYRADSFGIEFTVIESFKEENNSDKSSDKNVFFVLTTIRNGSMILDRSMAITSCLSKRLFNGAFSPRACALANAGYIGMQSKDLMLEFASSTGNSDVEINGTRQSDDLPIHYSLLTCGRLSFTTGEIDQPVNENEIIEVESGGLTYRGYVEEATFKYANNEAVKYKIIVKDIEPWY